MLRPAVLMRCNDVLTALIEVKNKVLNDVFFTRLHMTQIKTFRRVPQQNCHAVS
jgi:hypothetical protein